MLERTATSTETPSGDGTEAAPGPCLVVQWSRDEPDRVGEVAWLGPLPGAETWVLGRGTTPTRPGLLEFARRRPGRLTRTGPLRSPKISREQLTIRAESDGSGMIVNCGSGRLAINDRTVERGAVVPGDVIELDRRLLLLWTLQPRELPSDALHPSLGDFPFGGVDGHGFVGESPAAWRLRSRIQFVARRDHHVLVLGPSGTGKELVARAVHSLSRRARHEFCSRNAATIPASLIDAELFGNMKDYPNPGMRERSGLIGEAHGSTLFLDEIGELSHELQAHLLRVMELGEYQRLGEAKRRVTDLRLVAATNRAAEQLKHDFLARFPLRIHTQALDLHSDDIPLLVRHRVKAMLEQDVELAADLGLAPPRTEVIRPSLSLIKFLVHRRWTAHVRELDELLWRSLAEYRGSALRIPEGLAIEGSGEASSSASEQGAAGVAEADEPSAAELAGVLASCDWVIERAWRELGLRNRHQLRRLMQRHAIAAPADSVDPSTISRTELIATLERCDGVREKAWRELGLRNRHQLLRLLKLNAIDT